jgi:hypothetical protein
MAQCVPPFGFFWISGSYGPISNDKSILLVNVVDTLRLVGGAPKEFITFRAWPCLAIIYPIPLIGALLNLTELIENHRTIHVLVRNY